MHETNPNITSHLLSGLSRILCFPSLLNASEIISYKAFTCKVFVIIAPISFRKKCFCTGSKSAVTSEGLTSSLEGVEVFDITGNAIRITDLWKDRKAVVAFARHFG